MDDLAGLRLEQLTAELAWMRRLAYALVKDSDVADDVSHDAWLAAHDAIPDDRPLRPWLSRVVLNVVRMRSRSHGRRVARETTLPEPSLMPSPEQLVDRLALQRALADEVLALAEPYRSTVLLHYFEGLSTTEIAERLAIPAGTVRRRLKVALDELRARFAKRDRRGLLALAPLIGSPARTQLPIATTVGSFTMKKWLVGITILIAVLVAIAVTWWTGRDTPPGAPPSSAATTAPLAQTRGTGSPAAASRGAWLGQRGVTGRKIAGRVIRNGAAVAGATVRLGNVTSEAGGPRLGDELVAVKSGADGSFDFGVQPAAVYSVSAEAPDSTPAAIAIATADPTAKPEAIVLQLGTCSSRLYGTIVDASGGGVAKARLTVAGLGGAEASPTGEYALCVPMGDSRVRIVADGYGAIDLPIHLVGALRRDFELVPESVLSGNVVDEANHPVPYARVLAVPQKIEQPHFLGDGSTTADAEGRFRIANLAPGRFLLAASAEGYGSSGPKSAVAAPGTPSELTLMVVQRAQIRGHVVMNGAPVPGARVGIASPNLLVRGSYSQADGSFILDGVPLGPARLTAAPFDVASPKDLVIKTSLDDLTVEVTDMASLVGRVLRHEKPIADALIQTTLGTTTRSDASGHYELRGLPPGDLQVTAQVFGETNAFSPFTPVKIVAGTRTEHDIELTGGAEVHGTVIDDTGAPVPNVYIRLIDPKGDLGESMTDDKGAFACTSMLGGGDYRVAVFPSPGARTAFPPAAGDGYPAINIPDGNAVLRDVRVAIKNQRLSIAGRVVDDSGAPVADVHVEAIGRGFGANPSMLPSVRADVGGTFVIGDLARGTYTLHAHAGDGSEVEVSDVAAGATGVELRLIRPGSIEGQLVGFKTTPRVHARQVTAQLAIGNEAVIEGDRFTITGLTPGKYILEALADDQNDGQPVEVRAGQVTKVTLQGRGRGTVQGTVTEFAAGTPIKGMACWAAQSMDGQSGDIQPATPTAANTTTEAGTFKISAPIGKARVMCFSPDGSYSVAGGDVEVTAGTPGQIALRAVRAEPPPCEPGFRIKPLTLPLVIANVDPHGPAKAAGLAPGDKLISVDGAPIAGLLPGGAMMLAWNHRAGSTLVLGVERNGAPKTIKVVVAPATN
ncbi:MAG: sigma-70 family RNA polymerase sigma factor [Kofleriaceae bacterium]